MVQHYSKRARKPRRVAKKRRTARRAPPTNVKPRSSSGRGHQQGFYIPRHPEKYKGDVEKIVYRSSWELQYCEFLDNNPNVIQWSSEEIAIPYRKPTDGRVHRYYPDFWVRFTNRDGKVVEELIEIKPLKQVNEPTTQGKRKKQQIYEQVQHAVNRAKWEAAGIFCNKYNMKFKIITERDMFK